MSAVTRCILVLLALLAMLVCTSAPAQLAVTQSGSAAFSLPIGVPPGIAGMTPNLAIAYSGGNVNGPVGLGWSIQGISMITRCPQTRTIDGYTLGVTFSSNDKLCLDGQRLIQTSDNGVVVNGNIVNPGPSNRFQSGDSLGGSGSVAVREYRTEKDSYARVRAYGSAGGAGTNGPAFFRVWTKGGQIYEYGNNANASANAAIVPFGKTVVVAWAVSRIADTVGNFIDFQYEQRDVSWGSGSSATSPLPGHEWNVQEIRYTGNGAQLPSNKVVFTYDDRVSTPGPSSISDRAEAYQQGSKNVSIRRLNSIRTYVNAQGTAVKVKTLKFAYDNGPQTNRSRLIRITECAGAAEAQCLPPTVFGYSGGGDVYQPNAGFASGPLNLLPLITPGGSYGVLPVDFNGDGRTDILRWGDNPADNKLYFSNGDGSFTQSALFALNNIGNNLFRSDGCFSTLVADLDGDGLPDLFRYSASIGTSGTPCAAPPPTTIHRNRGDGTFDSLAYNGPALSRVISTKSYCTAALQQKGACVRDSWTQGANFFLLDVDGDGIPDLVTTILPAQGKFGEYGDPDPCLVLTCTRVYKGDGRGNFAEITTNLAHVSLYNDPARGAGLDAPRNLVDIDGDGLVDIQGIPPRYDTNASAFRSRGDGNFDALGLAMACTYPLDFNGDGRADCLQPDPNGVPDNNALRVSIGALGGSQVVAGFNLKSASNKLTGADAGVSVVDLNADGRHDILRWNDDPTQTTVYVSNGDGTFTASTTFNLNTPTRQLKRSSYSVDFVAADFTGRGSTEFLRMVAAPTAGEAGSNQLYEKIDKTPPDQLMSVTSPSGLSTTLTWVPLSNSISGGIARYVSDRSTAPGTPNPNAASYPWLDLNLPLYVVATSTSDSGVGAARVVTEYGYAGLKSGYDGRGSKGFREVRRQSPGPNGQSVTVLTQYLQEHPYIGVASKTETFQGGLGDPPTMPVSSSVFTYCDKTAPAGAETSATSRVPCSVPPTQRVQIPYLYRSVESGNDIDSARTPLPTVTTLNAFDNWGNPTSVEVTTVASVFGTSQTTTRKTTNVYTADTSGDSWILGRLFRATQDNSVPNVIGSVVPSAGGAPGATATAGSGPTQFATLGNIAFGAVSAGSSAVLSATLTNTGGTPLTLTVPSAASVTGAGFTFVSTTCGSSLGSNASCTISVKLAPTAAGAFAGSLSILTGAGTRNAALSGTGVVPSVVFQPVSTNWGSIGAASDSGDWPLIRNNGAVAILVTGHAPTGGPAGMWSSQGGTGYCAAGSTVLAPGAACTTFFGTGPLAAPGSYSATDQISYQVVGNPGVTFTTQQTYTFAIATTTASSGGLAFGNVTANTVSVGQTFTLTNNALNGGTLKNLSIAGIGLQPANFPLAHNCGNQLASGASCQVTVAFNPTSIANGFGAAVQIRGGYPRMQGGVDTGVVAATGVDLSIPLTGNGAGSAIAVSANGAAALSAISGGTAASGTVTFTNSGNAAANLTLSGLSAPYTVAPTSCFVAAGASCSVTVTMGTGGTAGSQGAQTLLASGGTMGSVGATVAGSIIAATSVATLASGDLAFGSLAQYAAPPTRTLTFRNGGNSSMSLTGWTNLPAALTVTGNTCSAVAVGASCIISIRLSTSAATAFSQTSTTVGASSNAAVVASGTITAAPALTVSVTGADLARDIYSNYVYAVPSGGVGPYTYQWTKLSGVGTINISGSATSSSVYLVAVGYCRLATASMQVVVSDSQGHQVTANGTAAIWLGAAPGKTCSE